MAYFIFTTDNCVSLTCEGDVTLNELTAAWREVQAVLAKNGKKRILVDVTTIKTSPQMEELFDLAKLLWREFPQGGRIALVVRWDQTWFAKSLEMLVRNVGVYLTVFVSEEQAEAWILENAKDPQPVEEFAN
jgi:hypothetical protein